MSYLEALLAARARVEGRAQRMASYCHRRLAAEPIVLVLFEVGAEPYTIGAVGYGTRFDQLHMAVPGEPRNRDLAFAALGRLARFFNPRFEAPGTEREPVVEGSRTRLRARQAPQVVVANTASVELIERLGRRLAYLPTTGARPADPSLVRLGQHLQFLAREAARPGQQLVVPLTELVGANWATAQSGLERLSLGALDAWIEPPAGLDGFRAAAAAELHPDGPMPDGRDDERLYPLVAEFNERRGEVTNLAALAPLLGPIRAHYAPLVVRTWRLVWRCLIRELGWPEAPSVEERWTEDREAYTNHLDWLAISGRRRVRQDVRQAAMTLRRLENAQTRLLAEEALDDPLRMVPHILANEAVEGMIVAVDAMHREQVGSQRKLRPLVTLKSPDPCVIPADRLLWWSERPHGAPWSVHEVGPTSEGGARVTLKLLTNRRQRQMPQVGDEACFSVFNREDLFQPVLPREVPWTHRPDIPPADPSPIEEPDGSGEVA